MIDKVLVYILACCNNNEFDQTTVTNLSENLKVSRSQVSVVLNKLVKENKLVRIESKPFCFISVEYLKKKEFLLKRMFMKVLMNYCQIKKKKILKS
ncbi:hypothetical protein [uncultured Holdemanella sp.]|uniref:hypothetical protein n=1 Tax=uncultured Holdemanella sp. TaxID=1763549 RepID=UPI0025F55A00|nr:hypothetical protein [uncultured Holdemanella sp.]